jgi:hypothetical protein
MRTLPQQEQDSIRGKAQITWISLSLVERLYALDDFRGSHCTLAARLYRPCRGRLYPSASRNRCDCFNRQASTGESSVMSRALKITSRAEEAS